MRLARAAFVAVSALALCALGQPLAPRAWLAHLPDVGAPAPADSQARGLAEQAWAMVGREDRIPSRAKPACSVAEVDPVEAVARAAARTQIVIVNEAHDSPRDRAFIADLAVRLADEGFNTYAAETFFSSVPREGKTPTLADGWYSQEPVYGALLRALRREGYAFVAYEDETPRLPSADFVDGINAREAGQASNLINRVFLANRDAKVLVHVGYSHNDEAVQPFPRAGLRQREVRWLARRLKDILGVDPLTIDQTTYSADSPGLCVSTAAGPLRAGRDLYMAHPPLAFDRNRPTWRDDTGARTVEVPRRLKRETERVVIEARLADEPADAVPADRVLIDPGEDIPLLLAPGRYKVRALLKDGATTRDETLTVRQPPKAPAISRVSEQN